MPDVQGPGGVGGDEFDVKTVTLKLGTSAIGAPRFEDRDDKLTSGPGIEGDVDKSWTCHLCGVNSLFEAQFRCQGFSELPRIKIQCFGEFHGHRG